MAAAWWVLQLEIMRNRRNLLRIIRKGLRDTSNPFEIQESQFIALYRLSKDATFALCENIRPHVPQPRRVTAIPLELKLLATLHFLSSGSYQRKVGQDFLSCMSQSSMSGAIHVIVNAINIIMPQWIQFPVEPEHIRAIQEQFWINANFPGVIGAVDGTHVAIWPPDKNREHLYINRKLYHSLNVMIVSDYYGKILAVLASHGGRTHDARVWSSSQLSRHMLEKYENGRRNVWLLGDSGYPLLPYLMTPKRNQEQGSPGASYTDAHVKARCSIERTIGVLKGRWRCLRKERALHYVPEFAGNGPYSERADKMLARCYPMRGSVLSLIINATCVLHNIAKQYNIEDIDVYMEEDIEDIIEEDLRADLRIRGNAVRETIIRRYFT